MREGGGGGERGGGERGGGVRGGSAGEVSLTAHAQSVSVNSTRWFYVGMHE